MQDNPTKRALQGYPAVNEAWLRPRDEPAIDPEVPVIDAHHHLWNAERHHYLMPEALADFRGSHNVVATVFAQCHAMYRAEGPPELRAVGEIEFANGIAAQSASGDYGPIRLCAGLIGDLDLTLGARVEGVLDAMERAGGGRLRGMRPTVAYDRHIGGAAGPGALLTEAAEATIGRLAARGLVLDVFVFFTQLEDILALARRHPDLQIVLNHCGGNLGIGPYASDPQSHFAWWRDRMAEIAQCENVALKIGGHASPRYPGFNFHLQPEAPASQHLARAWQPIFDSCLNSFGAERCMFESNFPVDKISCSYSNLWNAFKRLAAPGGPSERSALLQGTARRIYRLDLPATSPSEA